MPYISSFIANIRDVLGIIDTLLSVIIFAYLCVIVVINRYLCNVLMMSHRYMVVKKSTPNLK